MDGPTVLENVDRPLKLEMEVELSGHAAAKWPIVTYLRKSCYFFSGFPSRIAQFVIITGTSVFPR